MTSIAECIVEETRLEFNKLSFLYFDDGEFPLRKNSSSFPVTVTEENRNSHNTDGTTGQIRTREPTPAPHQGGPVSPYERRLTVNS